MPKALVRNAADPDQVAEAKKAERFRLEQRIADWQLLLAMPEGRRVFWELLGETNVSRSIFEASARIYYNAGKQDVGHWLQQQIATMDPRAYILMQQEAAKLAADIVEPASTSDEATE